MEATKETSLPWGGSKNGSGSSAFFSCGSSAINFLLTSLPEQGGVTWKYDPNKVSNLSVKIQDKHQVAKKEFLSVIHLAPTVFYCEKSRSILDPCSKKLPPIRWLSFDNLHIYGHLMSRNYVYPSRVKLLGVVSRIFQPPGTIARWLENVC